MGSFGIRTNVPDTLDRTTKQTDHTNKTDRPEREHANQTDQTEQAEQCWSAFLLVLQVFQNSDCLSAEGPAAVGVALRIRRISLLMSAV